MSFLSIAFLAALPLLAAPLLLHLFDRRRNVVIEWGAMQFLMDAATVQSSPRRVQHWLLLVLRMASIAALILALAQPMLPAAWFGGSGHSECVLVIDNSMSTSRTAQGKPLFDELIRRAEKLLDATDAGQSVRVMTTSPYPMWMAADSQGGAAARAELREKLRGLRPTFAASDLQGALLKAVQWESDDAAPQTRRVVLLTDGQAADWKIQDVAAWARFHTALANAPLPTTLELLHLGDDQRPSNNLAVNRVRSGRAVVGVDQPLTVTAEIQNFSAAESKPSALRWLVDGAVQHDGALPSLAAGETHEAAWTHSFSRTGVFRISCRVDAADDLSSDNQESLVVQVVHRLPVLLVEGAADLAEMQQDAYLVQAALGWVEGDDAQRWQAVFEPRTVTAERLESMPLDAFRAVVLPNLTELSPKAVARLTDFVIGGGGLWVALGPRTDVAGFNRYLFKEGEGLSPVALDMMVNQTGDGSDPKVTINPFLKEHPATRELADHQRLDTGDVQVTSRFRFRMPDGFTHVPVLLDLSNGEPLAVEKQVGKGRVIIQGVPLRLQWSDLAVSQAFVVMVHDWLGYLTEPSATRHNLHPGDPISIELAGSDDAQAILTLPDGHDVPLAGERVADGVTFHTSHTILPGPYLLELGSPAEKLPFQVGRDAAESDLSYLSAADRQLLEDVAGLDGSTTTGRIASAAGRRQHYRPLWPALLGLLIALIAGELLLSGIIARKRFGSDAIAETGGHALADTTSSFAVPGRAAERTDAPTQAASSLHGSSAVPAGKQERPAESHVF